MYDGSFPVSDLPRSSDVAPPYDDRRSGRARLGGQTQHSTLGGLVKGLTGRDRGPKHRGQEPANQICQVQKRTSSRRSGWAACPPATRRSRGIDWSFAEPPRVTRVKPTSECLNSPPLGTASVRHSASGSGGEPRRQAIGCSGSRFVARAGTHSDQSSAVRPETIQATDASAAIASGCSMAQAGRASATAAITTPRRRAASFDGLGVLIRRWRRQKR